MGKDDDDEVSHALTTTMWKFAVGLVALIFAGLMFVNEQYLTIREHTEYKSRVDAAVIELQTALRNHTAGDNLNFVGRNEFDRWLRQDENQSTKVAAELARIEATRPTTGELQTASTALIERIKRLEEQITALQAWQRKVNEGK
jgi:hypothetical protein